MHSTGQVDKTKTIQKFYDEMSDCYHLIFSDWEKSIAYHARVIDKLIGDKTLNILDCACGIGTQSLGLAQLGYKVTGSDISKKEIERAKKEAKIRNQNIEFFVADFCNLSDVFKSKVDVIIAMDNALPHMIQLEDLQRAITSIYKQLDDKGMFIASIRDYDEILKTKPQSPAPYIIKTPTGKRVTFQLWDWKGDCYDFTQYIINDDEGNLEIHKFDCNYRAITREEISRELLKAGFKQAKWLLPEDTEYYQPIVCAKK